MKNEEIDNFSFDQQEVGLLPFVVKTKFENFCQFVPAVNVNSVQEFLTVTKDFSTVWS